MRVLVTGGAGFIGSSLLRSLLERNHVVVNIDTLTYAGRPENLCSVSKHRSYMFEKVDIRDRNKLDKVFYEFKPDAVIHLAAESHVDRSINAPADFIETNINGTLNMLEATRCYWERHGNFEAFRFLHVSTDEVFGSLGKVGKFSELTPYNPRSPYSASKASSDHLVRAWFETYSVPVVISNCSNNYGPRQFPEKLIPRMILRALKGKSLPVYGDGRNIRDWLYVEDHVNALILLLEKGELGRSYNIGGNNELNNLGLVENLCGILDKKAPRPTGSHSELIEFVTDRPGHDFRYAIDATRIHVELGWTPSITLTEGLDKTVSWYLENEWWWRPLL